MQEVIPTTVSFNTLGVRARMCLMNDIRRFTSEPAKQSLRMALLWVNTALDAHRVGETLRAKIHLGNARTHIKVAVVTEQYDTLFPITMLSEMEGAL